MFRGCSVGEQRSAGWYLQRRHADHHLYRYPTDLVLFGKQSIRVMVGEICKNTYMSCALERVGSEVEDVNKRQVGSHTRVSQIGAA